MMSMTRSLGACGVFRANPYRLSFFLFGSTVDTPVTYVTVKDGQTK